MKKIFTIVVIIMCCLLAFPATAYARNYNVAETDLSFDINDTYWYVFTRDNLENNSELSELGVSYDAMYSIMNENMAFVDAVLYYDTGDSIELLVRKTKVDQMANLSNYDDDDVLEVAEAFAEKVDSSNYSIYQTQYKFVKLDYTDSGFFLCEYVTVVNGESYTFTFQASKPFVEEEYDEIEAIMESVHFDIDASLKEPNAKRLISAFGKGAIKAAGAGAILAVSKLLFGRKKRKTKADTAFPAAHAAASADEKNFPKDDT